jgi:hypothetical protein
MAKKATAADAQVIMQLYDLRREAELRKARNWWLTQFWPESAEDFMKIAQAMGSQENNWLRQAGGYWGMACALVESGAVNRDLFLQPANSGEMFFMFAKVRPFLADLREKLGDPHAFSGIEAVINSNKWSKDRIKLIEKRVAGIKERAKAAKSA